MLNIIYNTEIEYVKCFSSSEEDELVIRLQDDKLPDMYCHNLTLIKDRLDNNQINELIRNELEGRRLLDKDFLRIEANFDIDKEALTNLSAAPEVSHFDYMLIDTDKYAEFKGNAAAIILEASQDKVLKDAIDLDILSNPEAMKSFTERKIKRKAEAYASSDNNLHLFVCYYNDTPIGSCELFINGPLAKLEEFYILDDYQRKGFGTSVLKHLLMQAHSLGVRTAYLVTDSSDTAKDMYTKCGFTKVGQKTAVFFKL